LKARNYIEQAFEAAERIGDIELIGQVIPDLFTLYLPMGEHAKAIDVLPRVIDTLEREQKQAAFFGGLSNIPFVLIAQELSFLFEPDNQD
jgi:hypothetical protein